MTFSDVGPETSSRETGAEHQPRPLTGGAARQARYRAARQLRSIDVRAETVERIARLCTETSLSTHAVLALALDALEERLRPQQPNSTTPRRKQMPSDASPVTPNPMQQELF
jgi:hypothetical protein